MPASETKPNGRSSSKSFTAHGRRLTAPPRSLVKALQELGDEESAQRLIAAYEKSEGSRK